MWTPAAGWGRTGRGAEGPPQLLPFLGLLSLQLFPCAGPSRCAPKPWRAHGGFPAVGLSCSSRALPLFGGVGGEGTA